MAATDLADVCRAFETLAKVMAAKLEPLNALMKAYEPDIRAFLKTMEEVQRELTKPPTIPRR